MKLFLILLIMVIIGISGCISSPPIDIDKTSRNVPIISEFLSDYPNAELRIVYITAQNLGDDKDFLENCQGVDRLSYYKVSAFDPATEEMVFAYIEPEFGLKCSFRHEDTCDENWVCSDWTDCTPTGTQSRDCTDLNKCGTTNTKPTESIICEFACEESWSCGEWSVCFNNSVTRSCTDQNNCGTEENKPVTWQYCTCVESWNCTEWGGCVDGAQNRTCSDLNDCGTAHNLPATNQSCQSDQCVTDSECNDNNDSTYDACSGAPKTCSHTPITSCLDNDGFCPAGCASANDDDCGVEQITTCGENNETCFLENLNSCNVSNATFKFDFEGLFNVTTLYEVNGVERNICNLDWKYLENPNPDYLDKKAFCDLPTTGLDNITQDFDSFGDYMSQNMFTVCTGPLIDYILDQVYGCPGGVATLAVNVGIYYQGKLVKLKDVFENLTIELNVSGFLDALAPLGIKTINGVNLKNIEANFTEQWATIGFDCIS